jgi:stage V sporulation protein G
MKTISEIQIVPVKPNRGLVGFCSFILYESIYCSSVAIFTRPEGTYRLVYPTKKLGDKDINVFHPISKSVGRQIEKEVIKKFNDVMKNDRYNFANLATR